jgi:hypothetical protein
MTGPWKVFLSHTSELRQFPTGGSCIAAVEKAVQATEHVAVDMDVFPARDQLPADMCVEKVREGWLLLAIRAS